METKSTYTAFEGDQWVCRGPLPEVIMTVKRRMGKSENRPFLIFSDATGNTMDFNFQGSEKDVVKRLEVYTANDATAGSASETNGPGRPKLGVISREVSLLPRQWEWLASQSGGASAILRRLVDEERKKSIGGDTVKKHQERTYKFISVMAGDLKGYEEALRALYRKDPKTFQLHIATWPTDVKAHALKLAQPVFEAGAK